ncbi:MAG: ABC-F family ATP-binding cassette domain-containing protein, partial [Desulfobacterales bacterium]|nr:ABC-F family ATP-binding cassette domain-containing protein [Desulfobacterales bacterium]
GKSTLLKIIAGLSLPDDGEVVTLSGHRIVYLAQEDKFDLELTVEETLYHCLADQTLDDKERHRRVNQSLGKGNFEDPSVTVAELSGGWRKRLAITRALCKKPDLLLLDEPTNHLDISGIVWLEKILANAPFSFLVVSHDRAFLENGCSGMMEIAKYYENGYFKIQGQYNKFERERDKFLTAQQKQQASLASKMRREDEWLRQGAKARTTKAKYRIDQAEKLRSALTAVKERNRHVAKVELDFDGTGRQTRKLLRVHNLKKGYEGKDLFSKITFELGPGFCLGVVGENGSGKSTFLSLLEKTMEPDEGTVKWVEGLKVGVFDQNRSRIDPEIPLRDALNPQGGDSVNFRDRSIHLVTWAKRFLFMPDQLDMPVKRLSGGEKARIVLANLMRQPSDVLLLDEPTNDLDILSLEVLEQSIREFPGAVVIVSHDRYLMDRVCHRMLYLEPGIPPEFYRNFDQIMKSRKAREDAAREERAAKAAAAARAAKAAKAPTVKKTFSYKDKFELEQIEGKILEAEERAAEWEAKVQDPEIAMDPSRMAEACAELEKAQSEAQNLYDRWEELEEKREAAGK